MKKYFKAFACLLAVIVTGIYSCKDSFYDGIPRGQYTVDNYFKSPEQVQAVTAALYGAPWFDFNCTYSMSIGDVYSGNSTGDANAAMIQFQNMNVTQANEYLQKGWASLYSVVGQANQIIKNVNANQSSMNELTVNTAIGESRFMRAAAYFYLVRLYGPVPVIPDTVDITKNYLTPRHIVSDVYRFIIEDLKAAETLLPNRGATPGRVSAGAAKALLAKVYLTQKDYNNAAAKAWEVIANEGTYGYGLLEPTLVNGKLSGGYADLFFTRNNNNKESVWALQWVASNAEGAYGTGNVTQAYVAPYGQELTGGTDGWGSFKPSIDLMRDSIAGDLRRQPTYMRPDDFYPELLQERGGYTYPGCKSRTGSNVKKYVVGNYNDNASTGGVYSMSTGINTYMIRYPDVLLTYAEAILGDNVSTTDPQALAQFKRVRARAGLESVPLSSLTIDDILRERRLEFAFEGQYWFDILRLPQAKALAKLSNTERGLYESWCGEGSIVSNKINVTASMLLFPIPQSDLDNNPKLAQPPVPLY